MLYILISKIELRTFKIWAGHLTAIREVLDINGSRYRQIDILHAKQKTFKTNDIIINIGNHQYAGSQFLNELAESVSKAGRTVFFMDDYTAPPATQLRKALTKSSNLLVTNIKDLSILTQRKSLQHFEPVYVNLNKASFKKLPLKAPQVPGSFIYWGSCRRGREQSFYRYFKPNLYPLYISSSDRGHNKYCNLYINYRPLEKMLLPEDLQKYGFTVNIRDKKQPKMAPANRFYEAIGAGLPIFFDHECIPRIETPLCVKDYIVSEAEQLLEKDLQRTQVEQRKLWGQRNYRIELVNELTEIFFKHGIS